MTYGLQMSHNLPVLANSDHCHLVRANSQAVDDSIDPPRGLAALRVEVPSGDKGRPRRQHIKTGDNLSRIEGGMSLLLQ